jgi:glycosyltransferase involved in cell wall biosynthesis
MKLLFDGYIFRMQKYGGISRYFYELIRNFSMVEGLDLEVFAPLYVNNYLTKIDKRNVFGVHIPKVPYAGPTIDKINQLMLKVLIGPRLDIDIFHQTYFYNTDVLSGNAKKVLTVHDMTHEKFSINDGVISCKREAVKKADHIICISKNTKDDLIEILNVPPEKISVIYLAHSFDLSHKKRSKNLLRKPYILFVGNRDGYKNFENFISAFATSPFLKSEFDVVCFGGAPFNKGEQEFLSDIGLLQSSVTQLNGDDTLLADYYSNASAFVYPSKYEGFGIPLLESMFFECPVICSNTSSFPEVVSDAAVMFNPDDIESIRAAIESVLNNPSLRNNIRLNGLKRSQDFTWAKCAAETLDVYKALQNIEVV